MVSEDAVHVQLAPKQKGVIRQRYLVHENPKVEQENRARRKGKEPKMVPKIMFL